MIASKNCYNLIMKFEGCRLEAYKAVNSEKYFTIGYGHYGPDVYEGMRITEEQAESYLIDDVEEFESYVNKVNDKYNYNFNQNQFDALVSFTYNCGNGNLLKLCNYGKRSISEISEKIILYNKSSGKTLNGLVNRRNAEKELFDKPIRDTNTNNNVEKMTNKQVAKLVIIGLYGNGEERKIALEEDGYNYEEVQKEVNKMLGVEVEEYFEKCDSDEYSLVDALKSIGEDSSYENRKKIAEHNGMSSYEGRAYQNIYLLNKLKNGELRK